MGPRGYSLRPPWVIISWVQSLTAAAAALRPAITPCRVNTCEPFHRWKLEALGPMRDDLCTPSVAASQISTVKCLHACLAHAAQVFRLRQSSPGRTASFEKPAPPSSSLSLCVSAASHHGSGRPTKAFCVRRRAAQQKSTQKAADGVPPGQEEEKELVES